MPNRVPMQSVCVVREIDGVRKMITPQIGAVFEFTDAEVADIEKSNPTALNDQVSVSADSVEAKPVKGAKAGGKKSTDEL